MLPNNNIVYINGMKAKEFADIVVGILGTFVTGVTSLNYSEENEVTDNYSTGQRPMSRGYGRIKASGSITIWANEVDDLIKIAPNRSLTAISPFDIIVNYLDASYQPVKHILKNCQFANNVRSSSTGDTAIPVELKLVISHIIW